MHVAAYNTYLQGDFSARKSHCRLFIVRIFVYFLLPIIIFFSPFNLLAQTDSQNLEYKIKVAYLYNFTKFISWPEQVNTPEDKTTFNICVLKHNPFGHALDLLNHKEVNGHKLITKISKSQDELDHCHIVYFPRNLHDEYISVLMKLAGKNILTVSDIEGFTQNGGHIGLSTVKGKVRFDINLGATKSADLVVSAKLLELALSVTE